MTARRDGQPGTPPSAPVPGTPTPGSSEHAKPAPAEPADPPRQKLSPGPILAAAARAGRRDLWRILAVAVVVSLVTAVVEIIIDHVVDPSDTALSVSAQLSAEALSLLGTVFLSGFLCRLISTAEHGSEQERRAGGPGQGRDRVTIGYVARTLPWGRLALADILVTLLTLIGLIALVIPGLIIINLLAVTGPVIEIEDRRVLAALRRSARLVRPHFWIVALLATLPLALSGEIEAFIPDPSGIGEIFEVLSIRGLGEAALEAAIGLVLVELSFRLIAAERDRQRAIAAAGSPASKAGRP
jgi:hypothetical protein